MSLEIIILASGRGLRMRSTQPKGLQLLGGKPLLGHVLDSAGAVDATRIHVVHGPNGDALKRQFAEHDLHWVLQDDPRGTGHAVRQALPGVAAEATVCVLYADVPLISATTIRQLAAAADHTGALAILTVTPSDPAGFGRILRNAGDRVTAIREYADASPDERAIREVYSGFLACRAAQLGAWLGRINDNNAQGEYYLTDVVETAVADGGVIEALRCNDPIEVAGVNSRNELAALERRYQAQLAAQLMEQGVMVRDPARLDIRGTLEAGSDCVLDVNVVIEGRVVLGDRVTLGPGAVVHDTEIGSDVAVHAYSVISGARIGDHCRVGPFARVRPGTELAPNVRVGNFVELKKAAVGGDSKINHLSYVGDAAVGRRVNIGAGVITCNYDGAGKHRTEIGDDAFIGSNAQLVAPVKVGKGATVGAGSTITRDAPPGALAVARAPQRNLPGRRKRARKPGGGDS